MTETDILIIEDNEDIANLLRDFLQQENYVVSVANNGEKALRLYENYGARLVLLDIMLPGLDGFTICEKIRETSNTPIIIASARTGKEDKLNGLNLGADDYIEKPYDIDILLAKINGIFKRKFSRSEIIDGNIVFNTTKNELKVADKNYMLTTKEGELLKLLMENKGTTMKKEFLFSSIWGSDSESELQTLTVHIKWLRIKIPDRIQTVWGVGYRFE